MRWIIGIFLSALAMFLWGFVFFGSGLFELHNPVQAESETQIADTLRKNLPRSGFYMIPDPGNDSARPFGERMQAGPFARIHFHAEGVAFEDPRVMGRGFLHMLLTCALFSLALRLLARDCPEYLDRLKIAAIFGLGAAVFAHLGGPIWWFETWGQALKLTAYDTVAYILAGAILAKFTD
ncbi:MAG: hypothetical protein HS115_18570 [Spirochaetales bacterium]|nr:hypothetical protein [Spirochaetales bacterium]